MAAGLALMSWNWLQWIQLGSSMVCYNISGFGIIPTMDVSNFEEQLGHWESNSRVASKRILEAVSFMLRRTIERRPKEQMEVVGWRLLGVVSTKVLVLFLELVSACVWGELFACCICCKLFVRLEVCQLSTFHCSSILFHSLRVQICVTSLSFVSFSLRGSVREWY